MHESFSLNRKTELSDTSAVLEAFKFIENAAAEFSDEDEEEESEGKDRTNVESRTVRNQSTFPPSVLTCFCRSCYYTINNGRQWFPCRSSGRSLHRLRRPPVWTPLRTLTQRKWWRASTSCLVLTRWTPRQRLEAPGMAQTGVSHTLITNRSEFGVDDTISQTLDTIRAVMISKCFLFVLSVSKCKDLVFSLVTVHGVLVIHISCCGH